MCACACLSVCLSLCGGVEVCLWVPTVTKTRYQIPWTGVSCEPPWECSMHFLTRFLLCSPSWPWTHKDPLPLLSEQMCKRPNHSQPAYTLTCCTISLIPILFLRQSLMYLSWSHTQNVAEDGFEPWPSAILPEWVGLRVYTTISNLCGVRDQTPGFMNARQSTPNTKLHPQP